MTHARHGPELVLVRHGETEWSRSGQHTGRTDVPLTEAGRRHAELLKPRLATRSFALVLASPLVRARETCALAGLDGLAELEPDLREVDYGSYEGRTTAEIREERPGWDIWRNGTPDGESFEEAGERADHVIERALEAEGDVALIAHAHLLRVLTARWLDLPARAGSLLALGTAALSVLGWERERRVLWLWNDTAHIRDSSAPAQTM
jgi:probable phosphoglycerate mutase